MTLPKLNRCDGGTGDINLVAVVHGDDKYILLFTPATRGEALRTLGRWASNAELNFTWYDAAKASQMIRQETDP